MKAFEYTDNLEGWEKLKNTESCYLDGSYFNKVFARYPGLLKNPLYIDLPMRKGRQELFIEMEETNINESMPGLLRVIIESDHTRHSNLLIIDWNNRVVHRFEPLGEDGPYYHEVNYLIKTYLQQFFDIKLSVIPASIDEINDEKNPNCRKSGYCVAYIIQYAYAFFNGLEFRPENIRKFAKRIEERYGPVLGERDVEFQGLSRGEKQAVGGLGGAGIGALALGGPAGLLIGGAAGLGLGSVL
jgi:hypothetical protein